MKWFDNTALTLVIIGALNWLLVGIFKLDIVAVIFGNLTWISRIIYTIIGLCGLYLISLYGSGVLMPVLPPVEASTMASSEVGQFT